MFVSCEEIVEAFARAEQNKHGFASVLAEQFLALLARLVFPFLPWLCR
jgi:hypothetical protein